MSSRERHNRAVKAPDRTKHSFGLLWRETARGNVDRPSQSHLAAAARAAGLSLPVSAARVLDAGCGPGIDLELLATTHRDATVVGLDFNDAVTVAAQAVDHLANAYVVRGSVLAPPLAPRAFDFVYCYGVLHHTEAPKRGFRALADLTSPGGVLLVYVYTDLREEPVLRIALTLITFLRRVTTRMPTRAVLRLAKLGAPVIYLLFGLPAQVLRRTPGGEPLARRLPFNFIGSPTAAVGDLYDRFSAPIEHRHSRGEVLSWFDEVGFNDVTVTSAPAARGWIGAGRRPADPT